MVTKQRAILYNVNYALVGMVVFKTLFYSPLSTIRSSDVSRGLAFVVIYCGTMCGYCRSQFGQELVLLSTFMVLLAHLWVPSKITGQKSGQNLDF